MILALAFTAIRQSAAAAAYFPTQSGLVRQYEAKDGSSLTNKIEDALDMGGASAIPITESFGGSNKTTTYYRVDGDQVVIVAYNVSKPLPIPFPVFKFTTSKTAWDFEGKTAVGASGERLRAHAEAKATGLKNVLGSKVDTITVILRAEVGQGMSAYLFQQQTVYAKGLGIVEQDTKTILGKRSSQTKYKLVSIEPPK